MGKRGKLARPRLRNLTDDEVWKEALAHRPWVLTRVERFARRGVPKSDLIQEGMLGLFRAVELFDPARRIAFSTYATRWIDAYMRLAIAKRDLVFIPLGTRSTMSKVEKGQLGLSSLHPDTRTCVAAGNAAKKAVVYTNQTSFGDLELGSIVDRASEDDIGDLDTTPSPLLSDVVVDAICRLSPRQQFVILERIGLNEQRRCKTNLAISKEIGITKEGVRLLEKRALARLKGFLKSERVVFA